MGIGIWIKRTFGSPAVMATPPRPPVAKPVQIRFGIQMDQCVEVAGTTTFSKDAVRLLADRKGLAERGVLEVDAQLQREPGNTADPAAIAIRVEGERVGYLPSFLA
jgi:hypothetical protein